MLNYSLLTNLVAASMAALATPAAPPGRYLAATCANCHGTAGKAQGAMPSLAGRSAADLAAQLRAFRDGKRPSTIMQQLAKGYSDAQIDAIASYLARQPD